MDVNNVCRICDKPSTKLFGIFDKNADGKQILKLIRESLPVLVYRKDPLSKQICEGCFENVSRIHAFRKTSFETVHKQKERLKDIPNNDVLLYLDTLNSIDENEIWMYSSPIKKDMGKPGQLCIKCQTEIPPPISIKPFRKYKEAIRRLDNENSIPHMNGFSENVEIVDVDSDDTPKNQMSIKRLHKACHTYGSFPKRPRIMGPKCKTQPFVRSFFTETTIYNPLSLLNCCINVINKQNVPDVHCDAYEECIVIQEKHEYTCEYCLKVYTDVQDLAVHELEHIALQLDRVDNFEIWSTSIDGATCRNKWLRDNFSDVADWEDFDDIDEEDDDENLLMPLEETDNESKGEIVLIDAKPTVNGVFLKDIPKAERRLYYNRTYNLNGVKRKFCPLCRYTFKDNWAIELHYFSCACYYTCRFCGIRFNKQRAQFDDHVNQHIEFGDVKTDKVFAARKKNDPVPKVLSDNKSGRTICMSPKPKLYPKIKPLKMKQLFEKSNIGVKTNVPVNNDTTISDKQNQAYFCRKCYKVFFKLDEFNNHVNNCSAFPDNNEANDSYVEEKYEPPRKYQRTTLSPTNSRSDESFSSTGRPIRNCVKDITYRDNLDIDIDNDEEEEMTHHDMSFKGIECGLCSAVFPTIPSRNSHMRIHKNGFSIPPKSQAFYKHKSLNMNQSAFQHQNNYADEMPSYSKYDSDIPIKQEPLEPLVEIHESNSVHDIPSSIGAVSITPIPNKMQKTSINPDIMKLVQSNPNITIRSMHNSNESPVADSSMDDGGRSYKCSSCSKTYANKSNLYFHKKNQCEGSRYPCPFCKKRFGTEAAYSSHIFYSHPE